MSKAAERVARGANCQLPRREMLLGHLEIDGGSYLVRERSPHRGALDPSALDVDTLPAYAKLMGRVLAAAHARSPGARGALLPDKILRSAAAADLVAEIAQFAAHSARALASDHRAFKRLRSAFSL
jgi:hypothetical protein